MVYSKHKDECVCSLHLIFCSYTISSEKALCNFFRMTVALPKCVSSHGDDSQRACTAMVVVLDLCVSLCVYLSACLLMTVFYATGYKVAYEQYR